MMFGTSNTLARSFRTWSLKLRFLRKDGLLRRAMLALMHRNLQRAVKGWTVVYGRRHTVQMMAHVRGRLVRISKERSWASWMGVLVARAEALQLMQRGLARIMNRDLALDLRGGELHLRSAMCGS